MDISLPPSPLFLSTWLLNDPLNSNVMFIYMYIGNFSNIIYKDKKIP